MLSASVVVYIYKVAIRTQVLVAAWLLVMCLDIHSISSSVTSVQFDRYFLFSSFSSFPSSYTSSSGSPSMTSFRPLLALVQAQEEHATTTIDDELSPLRESEHKIYKLFPANNTTTAASLASIVAYQQKTATHCQRLGGWLATVVSDLEQKELNSLLHTSLHVSSSAGDNNVSSSSSSSDVVIIGGAAIAKQRNATTQNASSPTTSDSPQTLFKWMFGPSAGKIVANNVFPHSVCVEGVATVGVPRGNINAEKNQQRLLCEFCNWAPSEPSSGDSIPTLAPVSNQTNTTTVVGVLSVNSTTGMWSVLPNANNMRQHSIGGFVCQFPSLLFVDAEETSASCRAVSPSDTLDGTTTTDSHWLFDWSLQSAIVGGVVLLAVVIFAAVLLYSIGRRRRTTQQSVRPPTPNEEGPVNGANHGEASTQVSGVSSSFSGSTQQQTVSSSGGLTHTTVAKLSFASHATVALPDWAFAATSNSTATVISSHSALTTRTAGGTSSNSEAAAVNKEQSSNSGGSSHNPLRVLDSVASTAVPVEHEDLAVEEL